MGMPGALPFTGFGEAARIGAERSLLRRFLARSGEQPPEAIYAAIADEACAHRLDRCAAVLADWGRWYPGSDTLVQTVARVQAAGGTFGGTLEPDLLPRIRALRPGGRFGGDPVASLPITRVQRASEVFRSQYDHAFPFDPRRLLTGWQRCGGARDACERGRSQARRMLEDGSGGNGSAFDLADLEAPAP
jgi:hypothetical protein